MTEMAEQLEFESRITGGSRPIDLLKEMFLIPGNRKRAFITIGLMISQQMTGTNAIVSIPLYGKLRTSLSRSLQCLHVKTMLISMPRIQNYYAPQIFTNLGLTGIQSSLFATGIYGVLKMVGCAIFLIFVADSLGRRKSLLWTSIAQMICMFYIGTYVRISPPKAGVPVPPAGYAAIVAIYLFAIFCKSTYHNHT